MRPNVSALDLATFETDIAIAAWVRRLPFWLVNSNMVTECLQRWDVLLPDCLTGSS